MHLVLPLPPTVNHYWGRHGRITYVSRAGKAFAAEVHRIFLASGFAKLLGRLRLEAVIHPRDKRAIDLDNRLKPLGDALQNAGAYENDAQIDELYVVRGPIVRDGSCDVTVTEIA